MRIYDIYTDDINGLPKLIITIKSKHQLVMVDRKRTKNYIFNPCMTTVVSNISVEEARHIGKRITHNLKKTVQK